MANQPKCFFSRTVFITFSFFCCCAQIWNLRIDRECLSFRGLPSGEDRMGRERRGKKREEAYTAARKSFVTLRTACGKALGERKRSFVIFSVISYFTTFVPLKNVPMDLVASYSLNRYIDSTSILRFLLPRRIFFRALAFSFSLDFEGKKRDCISIFLSPHLEFEFASYFNRVSPPKILFRSHLESLTSVLHMFSVPWIMHSCQTAISFDQGQFYTLQSRNRFYSPAPPSPDFRFFTAPFLEVKISFESLPTIPTISATRHYPPFLHLCRSPYLIPSQSCPSKHPKNSNDSPRFTYPQLVTIFSQWKSYT